ncbi:MAG: response regulator transcription factor [Phaeodactylibacter sp.]|nr:response regulator transcription factor [Phaeodactylibacter sp.]
MKHTIRAFILPALLIAAALTALQAMAFLRQPANDGQAFGQSVNLALRQTADRLLRFAGDSTRVIPPVEQPRANEYLIRLQADFNYDSLPGALERAFAQYGIIDSYYVTITDCWVNTLLLGYSKESLADGAPCTGREQPVGCYNLSVIFPDRVEEQTAGTSRWPLFLSVGLVLIAALYYYRKPGVVAQSTAAPPDALIRFGNSAFDPGNQSLYTGDVQQELTFREAKLLHYFLQHANQLLQRNQILEAVWEDEGVIVGRSLDVFVSRLRKLLQADSTVKIANVHGVGYRLEVEPHT